MLGQLSDVRRWAPLARILLSRAVIDTPPTEAALSLLAILKPAPFQKIQPLLGGLKLAHLIPELAL